MSQITYSFFVTLCIVCTVCLNQFATAAPHMGGQNGNTQQHSHLLFGENDVQEWINPCGGKFDPSLSSPGPITKKSQSYRELYEALLTSTQIAINEITNLKAISTSDLSAWYKKYNNTFSFLPTNPEGRPKKWYNDTQMYVAAFQFLYQKQLDYDKMNNDGKAESEELRTLMTQAKSLLCEIETFINVTMKDTKVKIFTKQEMSDILKFRSNDSKLTSVLETVDKMFTKAKFQEYTNALQRAIQQKEKKNVLGVRGMNPCRRLNKNNPSLKPNRRCLNKRRRNQLNKNNPNGPKKNQNGVNINEDNLKSSTRQRQIKNKVNNLNNNKRKQNLNNKNNNNSNKNNNNKKNNPNNKNNKQNGKNPNAKKANQNKQHVVRQVQKAVDLSLKDNSLAKT